MADLRWTIEPVSDGWWACQHGTYGPSSVLAGQEFRQLVAFYEQLSEAQADYPGAEVLDHEEPPPPPYIPRTPPDWFDPLNAGEQWDEDD